LVREDAYRGCDVITHPYLENKGREVTDGTSMHKQSID
jgi:hypothetical protein